MIDETNIIELMHFETGGHHHVPPVFSSFFSSSVNLMRYVLHFFKQIGAFFRHLQWKLAFSYILMTAIALLITIVIVLIIVTNQVVARYPQAAYGVLREEAPTVMGDLITSRDDQQVLSEELASIDYNIWSGYFNQNSGAVMGFSSLSGYTVVTDFQGKVLASSDDSVPTGSLLHKLLPEDGMNVFLAARSGKTGVEQTVTINSQMILFGAKALITKRGHFLGVLVTRQILPNWYTILFATITIIWPALTLLVAVVGVVGLLYSLLMSRGLVRRFQRVAVAADAWGRGDFSLMARDRSGDELGVMARQLNKMAGKLEQLLGEQQRLAALEERNRLARDLHDSLKQQIFAITMQVWSAQAFLEQNNNVDGARERLGAIEHLLVQAQQELSSLIFQLRPVELAEKPFAEALREYCERWSQQQQIALHASIAEVSLSLKAEEALFRLVQEALSNIARHSGATNVRLELTSELGQLTLFVKDNGQGFDPQHTNRHGIGLLSMRERIEALGGSLSIESAPGKGTCIISSYQIGRSKTLFM